MIIIDWTLEVPIRVGDVIADHAQIDVTLVFDERGELHKLGVHHYQDKNKDRNWLFGKSSNPFHRLIWDCALQAVALNGERILSDAGVPATKDDRHDYTGPEYHPISL